MSWKLNPYLTSTSAPTSSRLAFSALASSLLTPSLIALGAASTNSLASFKPRLVNSLTSFTTCNFCAPADLRITSKDVFSSAAGAASPAAGAATTAAAAAGSIPYSSFNIAASSLTSLTVRFTNCSAKT